MELMSNNEDAIRALCQKAHEALSDAELLLENGSVEATINRAYYAVFSIARAALLSKGESPNTHSGVIRRFGYHFVRTEEIREEIGEILTTAESMRGRADYDAFSDIERGEAAELTQDAHRFVETIEGRLLS